MLEKSALRFTCLSRRDAMGISDFEGGSFAICERLAAYLAGLSLAGRSVALYNPINSEVDVTPMLHALDAEGVTVSLPVVEGGKPALAFYRFISTLPMSEGAFGILEPQQFERDYPSIIVVPLVGFDRNGHRIGYGKGYYDATLAELRQDNPSLLAIGVGFALQEVEKVPAHEGDMRLDVIITEQETILV